ncbi:hypothetical protein [Micromonospora sp. NPDC023644]|uniref:hypothetical protein n=1 Tax=Micromonospora sp. NPDC023644 TaxID=3154321 RepID=UPI0033C35CF2
MSQTTDDRRLLADVHRWARTNGWEWKEYRWENADTSITIRSNGFELRRRKSATGRFGPTAGHIASSIRQAVDLLVALGILPVYLSSQYAAGWHDGYFADVEDETAAEIKASWATPTKDTNPDRRCRTCGATSGLVMLPYGPLDPPAWECTGGHR